MSIPLRTTQLDDLSRWAAATTPVDPLERIGVSANELDGLIERVSVQHTLGQPVSYEVISVGYEDTNIRINAPSGSFVMKCFTVTRPVQVLTRYVEILRHVANSHIRHPRILRDKNRFVFSDVQTSVRYLLMDDLGSRSYLDLDTAPTPTELDRITGQAALINTLDFGPVAYDDIWAVPHFPDMLRAVRKNLTANDLKLMSEIAKRYETIPFDRLPHAFVHGDLTKANVILNEVGEPYVIDFSCANWYPRIQDIAIMSSNLMFDPATPLHQSVEQVVNAYSKYLPLRTIELDNIYNYALVGKSIEFLGSTFERQVRGHDSVEVDYWSNVGLQGLELALEHKEK